MQWAYPILKEAGVPFAVYVPTSFPDRLGELWWLALEAVIARNDHIGLQVDGRNQTFDCATVAAKRSLYDELYWWLRARPTEADMRAVIKNLAACYHVDIAAFCDELCMSWPEIADLAADPLVTIGAHTVSHSMLAKLSPDAVRSEMDLSRSIIEAALGTRPEHLSYPVGDSTSAGPREFAHRCGAWVQDRGHDPAGRAVSLPQPASDRAAADLAQWRVPAPALCACPAVRFGDGDVEWFSAARRSLGTVRPATSMRRSASPATPSRGRRSRSTRLIRFRCRE